MRAVSLLKFGYRFPLRKDSEILFISTDKNLIIVNILDCYYLLSLWCEQIKLVNMNSILIKILTTKNREQKC